MKKTFKVFSTIVIAIAILLCNTSIYANTELNVEAKNVIVVEKNTGKIMYEKNAYEKTYPASTTKILTAILVIEKCNLDDVATVEVTHMTRLM